MAALQSGDMDMIEYVPWSGMAAVEADPRLTLAPQMGPFMDILFNGTRPPFDNPLVRRAVAHAVKREDIVRVAFSGRGKVLDQFANPDNPRAHYETTGPEIWRDTDGRITHFVSAMGTTGTIMGVSHYLKEKNPEIRIIGAQPEEGSQIPGIRKWPEAYLPKIFDRSRVDQVENVSQTVAEQMARRLAMEEGIFAGISAAGACEVALRISSTVENAVIVFIVCDRGDRYLSTGVFPA